MSTKPGVILSDIILKQGDTFLYSFPATQDDGSAANGIASRFKSEVYNKPGTGKTKYGTLSITEDSSTPGTYILRSGVTTGVQDTQTWPEGKAVFDIQYTEDGIVRSTYTIQFEIVGDVTA